MLQCLISILPFSVYLTFQLTIFIFSQIISLLFKFYNPFLKTLITISL